MTTYDFIIVGAGSAGCVLAARLSEDPDLRVALIEAGGPADDPAIADPLQWPFLQGRAIDWQFATVPQTGTAGRVHAWPRGKVIGGSSCLHAMAHVRGHPSDFDAWADAGCDGWGFGDLLPYFIRSERSQFGASPYHGAAGPIQLVTPDEPHPITQCYRAAAANQGYPATDEHNGPCMAGPTLNTLTLVEGRRQSVANAYLDPILGRPNLTVRDSSLVARLLFDRGPRCTGVVLHRNGAEETLSAERGVVLSAGAIGSPALLLQSGIGPADELNAVGIAPRVDLAGVGRNLHDHLLSGGNLYLAKRPVPPSKYQHSESLLYANRGGASGAPELVVACVVVPVVTEAFAAPDLGEAYTLMFGFTHPASRGSVRLTSAEPGRPLLIDPNYLAEPEDRRAYGEALNLARRVGHDRALDDWRAAELLPGDGEPESFLEKAAYTHHHPVGTCRMGNGSGAVVAPDLSVHGVAGLYVIDASVMPTITTGPVNAAVVAIAERASDLLRGQAPLAPTRPSDAP